MNGKVIVNNPSGPQGRATSSQAVIVPPGCGVMFIRGLVSWDQDGNVLHAGDIESQARDIFEQMKKLTAEADASMGDVVKLTNFVRDIKKFTLLQGVRREYFPTEPPASTTIEVSRLAHEDLLIEIEAIVLIRSGAR
jgi:2-iminobutanoate/2-iminopropanoate deaminase